MGGAPIPRDTSCSSTLTSPLGRGLSRGILGGEAQRAETKVIWARTSPLSARHTPEPGAPGSGPRASCSPAPAPPPEGPVLGTARAVCRPRSLQREQQVLPQRDAGTHPRVPEASSTRHINTVIAKAFRISRPKGARVPRKPSGTLPPRPLLDRYEEGSQRGEPPLGCVWAPVRTTVPAAPALTRSSSMWSPQRWPDRGAKGPPEGRFVEKVLSPPR